MGEQFLRSKNVLGIELSHMEETFTVQKALDGDRHVLNRIQDATL